MATKEKRRLTHATLLIAVEEKKAYFFFSGSLFEGCLTLLCIFNHA